MASKDQRSQTDQVHISEATPVQPVDTILSPARLGTLLDPVRWHESLQSYVRATHLALVLTDAKGHQLGACLNPQPTWQHVQAAAATVAPSDQTCPFALLPAQPCTCIGDALTQGHVVFASDRVGLVHFAVPLILHGQSLGAVLAGQVFDHYPDQVKLERPVRQLGLSMAETWQKARLEYPIQRDTLHVYADLLMNISQTLLQTHNHSIQEAERLAEMTRLRNQAEQTRRVAIRAEEALQWVNADLEQRVVERTAELQLAHDALSQEISERQRMQEALFQREKLAALGTLLANVAHELNNPLAAASMELDNLDEVWPSNVQRESIETLRHAVARCDRVVKGFLAMARHQPPTRRAVNANAIVDEVLDLLQHTLEVDSITVHRHLSETLPKLWADAHQLHHVLMNLVTNAHHALRQTDDDRHLTLTTYANTGHSQVTLSVADTGPGIPKDLQRRIFDPFFTTKPEGIGSGLGLPLCRNIIEGHEGRIDVDSQPGHGTTVSVILPVGTSQAPSEEALPEAAAPAQTHRGSILIIDDEPAITKTLTRLLQRNGHEITTAANGCEGLTALQTRDFDVIFCDMRMAELDGPGFYDELSHHYPHLTSRLVFLTGDVMAPETLTFFDQVKRPRLVKPFKAAEVRRLIQEMLEKQKRK
jgi:signal transduction histidine kinase/ActR/RegA family two-component response regulator